MSSRIDVLATKACNTPNYLTYAWHITQVGQWVSYHGLILKSGCTRSGIIIFSFKKKKKRWFLDLLLRVTIDFHNNLYKLSLGLNFLDLHLVSITYQFSGVKQDVVNN